MGVYNPQMKMPIGCHRCEYYDVCKISNKSVGRYNAERSPGCPLVEVKVPHGDLVDREEIEIVHYEDADGMHIETHAPTVIEAEEKH